MRHDDDLLGMQSLKRADHLAQNVGGNLGIDQMHCSAFNLLPTESFYVQSRIRLVDSKGFRS
jgi:hypothetical protein